MKKSNFESQKSKIKIGTGVSINTDKLNKLKQSLIDLDPNQQKIQRKARDIKEWLSLSQNEDFNVYESKILEMRKYMKEI